MSEGATSGRPLVASAPQHRLATGVELVGQYQGSGLQQSPWLIRRGDGSMIQVSALLFTVAVGLDGRTSAEVATWASAQLGRTLSESDVDFLVANKFVPMGLVNSQGAAIAAVEAPRQLTALGMKGRAVPPRVVDFMARHLQFLLDPAVVVASVVCLAAIDLWLWQYGLGDSMLLVATRPELFLVALGVVLASMAFHELGHAAACILGGARPGAMGFGIHLAAPAFYTDVTDSYRLDRWGRLRTDLGGIYFSVLFALLTGAAYIATGFEPLLAALFVQHLQAAAQFVPFARLDGYHIVSDLVGVPNLSARMLPVLRSLVPWRAADPKVTELKPWARAVVVFWVVSSLAMIGWLSYLAVVHIPGFLGDSATEIRLTAQSLLDSPPTWDVLGSVLFSMQVLFLALPPLGMLMILSRLVAVLVAMVRGRRQGS